MKQVNILITLLMSILFWGCQKEDPNRHIDGGVLCHETYLLSGSSLISLHEHEIYLPYTATISELALVSFGIDKVIIKEDSDDIILKLKENFLDAEVFDMVDTGTAWKDGHTHMTPRYIQHLSITTKTNTSGHLKKLHIETVSNFFIPEGTDFTIVQESR